MALPQNILVTGGTGAVGPRVITALHDFGVRLRIFTKNPPPPALIPQDVEVHIGDISDRRAIQEAMEGMNAVVHLAAMLHFVNPKSEMRDSYEDVNVMGTMEVVRAAQRVGVSRIVYFSTIAVYSRSNGMIITETSLTSPVTPYAQTKLKGETIVLQSLNSDGMPIGTVLRLGAVYGPRIKGNYSSLVKALAQGRFVPVGEGSNCRTLIYDRDVAKAAVLVLGHPQTGGKVFNVSDGEYHTVSEIIATICGALGRKPPRLSLPLSPTKAVLRVADWGSKMLGRQSNFSMQLGKYIEDIRVSSDRIHIELGFSANYDLASGWRETVMEMRQQGLL